MLQTSCGEDALLQRPPTATAVGKKGYLDQGHKPTSQRVGLGLTRECPMQNLGAASREHPGKGDEPPHQVAFASWVEEFWLCWGPALFSHSMVGQAGLPFQRKSPTPRVWGFAANPHTILHFRSLRKAAE